MQTQECQEIEQKSNVLVTDDMFHSVQEAQELIKATALIHTRNVLTSTAACMYNWLLYFAFPTMDTEENPDRQHEVPVGVLCEKVGIKRNNMAFLRKNLSSLRREGVQYNIFGKDKVFGKSWNPVTNDGGEIGLLSKVGIENDMVVYRFDPDLIPLIRNPAIYGRIRLSVQSQLKNKHAIHLWEFFQEMLDSSKSDFRDFLFTLKDFRRYMGLENIYPVYKDVSRNVIKPSIKEINKHTGIQIELKAIRQNNVVSTLYFKIIRKNVADNPKPIEETRIINQKDKQVLEILQSLNIRANKQTQLIKQHSSDYILEMYDVVKEELKHNKRIKNVAAYFITALRDDYRGNFIPAIVTRPNMQPPETEEPKDALVEKSRATYHLQSESVKAWFNDLGEEERSEVQSQFSQTLDAIFKRYYKKQGIYHDLVYPKFVEWAFALQQHLPEPHEKALKS